MAMLLASQTDYAITDANEVKEALSKELPNMTMEIGEGTIKVSGDNSFEGSLVVDSAKDDQVQVTRSAGGNSESVTIYFVSENMIYVPKPNSSEGMAFKKSN